MKKKSYNPFKMWGSYVGALIFLIIPLPIYTYDGFPMRSMGGLLIQMISSESYIAFPSSIALVYISSYILIGFLAGWGIHSLFRLLKGGLNSSKR